MSGANLLEPANATRVTSFCRKEADSPLVDAGGSRTNGAIACGIFLFVLGVYLLSSPGRIDIIDGQARFDVAFNWLVTGRPVIRDNWIAPLMSVPGRDGLRYAYYGAPASVLAIPLVWLGLYTSAPAIQPSHFLFSLTSSIVGAAIAPLLFLFYLELGITRRAAFAWTMVSSFATLLWPSSNTTFDNAQHAFFALAAAYFGFLSARRKSMAFAVAGGLMGGILVLYQEYFLLIIPALALSTLERECSKTPSPPDSPANLLPTPMRALSAVWQALQSMLAEIGVAWREPGKARSRCTRYCLFLAAAGVGVIASWGYNDLRFGSWLDNGKVRAITNSGYPLFGNPIAGFLTLLVSPGKSIFLYSPTVILAFLGMGYFWRRHHKMALAVALSTLALVSFLSCICFVGGDWCWGPRYLTVLLPLWALAFPFLPLHRIRRGFVMGMIGLGLLVQVMALSVETQRFFFERQFNDHFWAEDPWVYFKHSALLARVGETLSLADGPPLTAVFFKPQPHPEGCTYTILGPPPLLPRSMSPIWMRHFKIFYLPRPWPLWMSYVPPALRPVRLGAWLIGLSCLTALGAVLIYRGFRKEKDHERAR